MADEERRNVRDLRRANRARVLRHLYFGGPLSRQDLISATRLSSASVSNVVSDLLEDRLVVEAGAVESAGGRPRTLLRINADRFHVVGVDVGETGLRVERFDLGLREVARAHIPVSAGTLAPEEVVDGIAAGLSAVLAGPTRETVTASDRSGGPGGGSGGGSEHSSGNDSAATGRTTNGTVGGHPDGDPDGDSDDGGPTVLGVGIGVPGFIERSPAAVLHVQTIGWDAVPLEAMLREVTSLPLLIDNGAATMAQAEAWFGVGRGAENAVLLLIGSGAGSSRVSGSPPYQVVTTDAGEWGHLNAVPGGRRCRCGGSGCLEAYVGAEAVIARYAEAAGPDSLPPGADEEAALRHILHLSAGPAQAPGAREALEVLDETAVHIGVGVAAVINLLSPERVIIGGWAGLLMGRQLLPRISEVVRAHTLRLPYARTSLELGSLGPAAVALGAASLPVSRFLDTGGTRPTPRIPHPAPPTTGPFAPAPRTRTRR